MALAFHTRKINIPICLLVISTVAFLFTLESKPGQNLSEFDGSVKPFTVRRAVRHGRSLQPSGLIHNMLLNTKMQALSKQLAASLAEEKTNP